MPSPSSRCILITFLILAVLTGSVVAGERYPGKHWMKYATPEDAGFSSEGLAKVRAFYDSTQASALFVVYKGAVVADWGESARRFMCHSMRKSLMSAMYGVYIDNGTIDTGLTLAQLGIDESIAPLTAQEKQARIADLLAARSGIYLLAAYEPSTNPKPARGSFAPGTNWCYNNWDFNALLTIFEKITHKKFFEDFDQRFAKPLQMQDYHPYDGYYHFEREKSEHAAYPFRMSARDLARFGLLYLNNGKWGDKQLVSRAYATHSTSRISDKTWTGGYGFLWWLFDAEPFKSLGMYSALGLGEHAVHVIPGADMVVVVRTNTYANDQVSRDQHLKLVRLLLDARTGTPAAKPRLQTIPELAATAAVLPLTSEDITACTGDYPIGKSGWTIKVYPLAGQLMLDYGEGTFPLQKLGTDHFKSLDDQQDIYFIRDSSSGKLQLVTANVAAMLAGDLMSSGQYDKAVELLNSDARLFADNPQYCNYIGEAYFGRASADLDSALVKYSDAVAKNPKLKLEKSSLGWWLPAMFSRVYLPDTEPSHLQRFAGTYGQRTVEMDNGRLIYSRAGSPRRYTLVRLTESIFELENDKTIRVLFHNDGDGKVDKLTIMYQDGRTDESLRTS